MVYSMSALINDTIKLQNVLMILMEICLILEFILLFSRIMRAVEKWKIAVSKLSRLQPTFSKLPDMYFCR